MTTDTKDSFNNANKQPATPAPNGPVSKQEKTAREAQRAKPSHQNTLKPEGMTEQVVNQQVDNENEARIKQIEARLANARQQRGMKRSFNKSK